MSTCRRKSRRRGAVECEAPNECFACGTGAMGYAYWDAQGDDLLCTACYRAESEPRLKRRYRRIALRQLL